MRGRRSERGAVALMVGVAAAVLVGVAAITVDLGNAMMQRAEVRKVTDLAALAGGGGVNLPGTTNGTCATGYSGQRTSASDQSVADVVANLNQTTWGVTPTTATLTDCSLANGEVVYGTMTYPASGLPALSFDKYRLTVVSPPRSVEFGLAGVLGFQRTNVGGTATVASGTPGGDKVFPAFATDGCDWGQRTIFAPAASNTGPSFTPDLEFPAHKNFTTFDLSIENPSPDSIPVNPAATTISLRGTGLGSVTRVGFFKEGSPGNFHEEISQAKFDSQSGTLITFTIPDDLPAGTTVSTAAGLWWVRVYAPKQNASDTTSEWSEVKSGQVLKTIPFEVGESYLRCAGVAAGSYGDIILPRTDSVSGDWNAMNMALNLQKGPPKLSLHTYPGAPTSVYGASTAPNFCVVGDVRTVYSTVTGSPTILERTNCVDNGTGLTANTATSGLIGGVRVGSTTFPGRLDTGVDTTCSPRRSVTVNGPANTNVAKLINNDRLTCFMDALNTTTPISTIAAKSYSGGAVLTCAIFDSPRFFYQPVLQVRPSGGSNHYSIVDFRPAFISEQDASATSTSPALNQNGVTITNGSVTQLDVIFFHPNALRTDCNNSFGPSLGGSTKTVLRLVD